MVRPKKTGKKTGKETTGRDRLAPTSRALVPKGMAANDQINQDDVTARPRTWAEIKTMVEDAGVCDADLIFIIDIGPELPEIYVSRDTGGPDGSHLVEITDYPNAVAKKHK